MDSNEDYLVTKSNSTNTEHRARGDGGGGNKFRCLWQVLISFPETLCEKLMCKSETNILKRYYVSHIEIFWTELLGFFLYLQLSLHFELYVSFRNSCFIIVV